MKLSFSGRWLSRLSHERGPSGELLPSEVFEKKLSKKLLKTFGSLKITPYLCTRFWEVNLEAELRKKNFEKKFRKNLEDIRKTPYLCNRFPIKRRASRRAIFEEIYINNTVVQEQNWKQFWVKKEPSILIYIGNELLIRNPDRATTYLDIIWYSGVKDTFTMKSLILAQDER